MPSNRNIKERQRAQREADIVATLSKHRERRKVGSGPKRLLDHLPREQSRAWSVQFAAEELHLALRRTKLLDPGRQYRSGNQLDSNTFVFALAQLLPTADRWIRRPDEWRARSHNAHRQFASLARHLLCRYDVPSCMDGAWFEGRDEHRPRFQAWFEHLGRGENIRTAPDLPCTLSRRAAHLFTTGVPGDLPILGALRWSQLRALGASDRLVNALLGSCMAEDFARDDFWMTAVRFFMLHPMLDRRYVGPILDFIDDRRHRPHLGGAPEQPNFSMKGRSPATLLRQVNQWHRDLRRVGMDRTTSSVRWRSCGIKELLRTEGRGEKVVHYRIRELLSAAELRAEGRAMHHCVATYARCQSGRTAIYALTRQDQQKARALLTIAVDPQTHQVVEASGHCNAMPTGDQLRVLRIWMQEAGLALSRYL